MNYALFASLYFNLELLLKKYEQTAKHEKKIVIPSFLIEGWKELAAMVVNMIGEKSMYTVTEFTLIDMNRIVNDLEKTGDIYSIPKDFKEAIDLLEKMARNDQYVS